MHQYAEVTIFGHARHQQYAPVLVGRGQQHDLIGADRLDHDWAACRAASRATAWRSRSAWSRTASGGRVWGRSGVGCPVGLVVGGIASLPAGTDGMLGE